MEPEILKLSKSSGLIISKLELFENAGINSVGTIKIIETKGIRLLYKIFKDIKPPRKK